MKKSCLLLKQLNVLELVSAPAVQVIMKQRITPSNAISLCQMLKDEQPELVNADILQEKFGGLSF